MCESAFSLGPSLSPRILTFCRLLSLLQHHRRRSRRSLEVDHRRRSRRNSSTQGSFFSSALSCFGRRKRRHGDIASPFVLAPVLTRADSYSFSLLLSRLQNTVNNMVESLNNFSSEVTRVAKEVGTYGQLGGQARVDGVSGTWKDLTDNVGSLSNLHAFEKLLRRPSLVPRRCGFRLSGTDFCTRSSFRSTSWLPT